MNISLDEARNTLRAAFTKFDTNKNGALDPEEAASVLKEIGVTTTKDTLKEFFAKIDTDHDGQISFEELYAWFLTSEKGESQESVAFRLMLLNKIQEQHEEILKNQEKLGDFMDHFINITVGKVENPKSFIEVRSAVGDEAKARLAKYSNGVEVGRIPFFIRIGCSNAEETKTKLVESLNGLLTLASGMGIGGGKVNFENFKITANHDESGVVLSFAYTDPMLELIANSVEASVSAIIPETHDKVVGKFGFYLADDLEDVYKKEVEGDGQFPALYVLDGFQIKVDAKYPKSFNQAVQKASMKQMVAMQSQMGGVMPFNPVLNAVQVISSQLDKYEINFQFMGNDEFDYSKLFPPMAVIKGALAGAANIPLDQIIMGVPGVGDLIELAENNFNADVTIGVALGPCFIEWQLKTGGVKKFWDYVKNAGK